MKKKVIAVILIVFVSGMLFAGGDGEERDGSNEKTDSAGLKIYVSIEPQRYFVEQIAGDRAEVEVMVPPGKSPATYEPTPRQVQNLGRADLFFTIGVNFEKVFLPSVRENLPELTILATDGKIEKRFLEVHSHDEDEHDEDEHEGDEHDEDEHDEDEHEGDPDPHVWMDPLLVIQQAEIIRDGLIEADPEGRLAYEAGYADFERRLNVLNDELEEVLGPVKGSTLFVYHPAFGYFGDRYGLHQVAVETGGREPGPAMLEEIIEHAQEEGVKVIFVQPEFSRSSAEAVARAIDGAVVPAAPLRADYIENMREIAAAVREGLLRD